MGGAENVLEELVALFPRAPVYTSMYAPDQMPDDYRRWTIQTSFMQRLPAVATHHQAYLPLYPLAFERMDLRGYDLVLSNKSGFCHGVQTHNGNANAPQQKPHTIHVCYCLTPTRFLWLYDHYREREQIGGALHAVLQPVLRLLRRWDWRAAQRVDHFVAISSTVQKRIETIYGRESVVIHPPVDTTYFSPDPFAPEPTVPVGDYYLIVSRLIPYKRIDLAVKAFNRLPNEKLLIVGDGRDRASLEAQALPNVQFLGRQADERVLDLLRGCKAFLFPGLEDFGIAPVEAMSVGRPVIAYKGGGALDTVLPGITGELFAEQTGESLYKTLVNFNPAAYDPAACRAQAEQFSVDQFRHKLLAFLQEVLNR
jgi:glycosyltransferase involved in cell wall biosynthesis